MEKILIVILLILTVALIILVYLTYILDKKIKKLGGFVYNAAKSYNYTTYSFAKFIETQLRLKAKDQDLTTEEKEFFQDARKIMNDFLEMEKRNRS